MAPPIKLLSHYCRVAVVVTASVVFQSSGFAFPLASEIRPFGENVFANGYGRRNVKSSVVYTETYLDEPMNNTIRAVYWDGNRKPISYKKLVFGVDSRVPEQFETIDYRRQRGYRVTVDGGFANVKSIRVAADGTETVRTSTDLAIDSNTVIDASFHRHVVADWEKLQAGKTKRIMFLQVDRARLVPLKIRKVECGSTTNTCLKISFDNLLLQGMAPNIYMVYGTKSKRLLRYIGLGPVTRLDGDGLPIDIVYKYTR